MAALLVWRLLYAIIHCLSESDSFVRGQATLVALWQSLSARVHVPADARLLPSILFTTLYTPATLCARSLSKWV